VQLRNKRRGIETTTGIVLFVSGHGYSRTFASLPTPTPTQEKVYYYVPHIKIHYYGGIEVRWHII